jgi:xylulokinase
MITLGIDLGTSGVKLALVDFDATGGERVVGVASRPLTVQRPHPSWSEQDPDAWWQATLACGDALAAERPREMAACAAISLSGQMHGATLLDASGRVLRPCMLWNDGRSAAECAELETDWPSLRAVTGNLAMPGFTAPKLRWVRRHEPEIFRQVAMVLLPKAWLRRQLCGESVEEMSDASGTLWLDVANRQWCDDALAACGLTTTHMPRLVEGTDTAGTLHAALASRWGMAVPPLIAGGAGDNAAGAVGVGAVSPGDAFVSLGTSGVLWCTTEAFSPNTAGAVHAFCHALPGRWHQMGVLLSAASCLTWWAGVTGCTEAMLLDELEQRNSTTAFFTPYLTGERTPHNDARVRAGFAGLDASHDRADMTLAVLEGVAYAFRDALDALRAGGREVREADLLGGGARSARWCQILADTLATPLHSVTQSEVGCASGAARLAAIARLGAGAESIAQIATRPARRGTFVPRPDAVARHAERHARWATLYGAARSFVNLS